MFFSFRKYNYLFALLLASIAVFFTFYLVLNPTPVYAVGEGLGETVGTAITEGVFGSCGGTLQKCFTNLLVTVGIWNIQFALFLLGIVGVLLDVTLLITFNMGAIFSPGTSAGQAVAVGWTIFRDLANLLFIAGFVWVSIAMILQIQMPGGSSVGKFVANIIIAALLVNFSYFFTGAIIDISNNTSRLIYEQGVLNGNKSLTLGDSSVLAINDLIEQVTGDQGSFEGGTDNAYLGLIGSQFLHQTKLISILDPEILKNQSEQDPTLSLVFLTFLGSVFIIMTIELFASMLFVILARFVILTILLILSPLIVFRIMGIPPFSDWGEQWWKALSSQVIFLPIFVFLVAISFRVIRGFVETFAGHGVTLATLFGSPTGSEFNAALGLIILFLFAFGMLKFSKSIAQNMAQGKSMPLPSVEGIQQGAAGIGNAFGSRIAPLGRAPGSLFYRLTGGALSRGARAVGDLEGVSEAQRRLGSATSRIPFIGNSQAFDRQERMRNASKNRVDSANEEIAKWEKRRDAAEAAGNVQGIAAAESEIRSQKERKKDGYGDMYNSMGATKFAQYLRQNPEQIEDALDALDDEKAAEIADKLRGVKTPKKEEGGGSGNNKKPKDGPTTNPGAVVNELKGMRRDQRIEAMREKKRDMTEITATKDGVVNLKTEVGAGALGELPVDLIIGKTHVLDALDDADMAVIDGRSDVTPEQRETIRKEREIQQDRKATPQPSDIARPETPPQEEPQRGNNEDKGSNNQPPMGPGESAARTK